MSMFKSIPSIPKALLEELEKRYPDKCPELGESMDQIRMKQGQVSVIRLLRAAYEFQNTTVLGE